MEALLAGLGACKSISARVHAQAQGIKLNKIRVDADNTEEEITEFIDFVEAHCPVQDTIEKAPNFNISIAE